jgi:hypothetical protein
MISVNHDVKRWKLESVSGAKVRKLILIPIGTKSNKKILTSLRPA